MYHRPPAISLDNGGLLIKFPVLTSRVQSNSPRGKLEGERATRPGEGSKANGLNVTRSSRYILKRIRREVYQCGQGQCAYALPSEQRCPSRAQVEFHNKVPFAHFDFVDKYLEETPQ